MHDPIIVGAPVLAIAMGIFFNGQGIAELETRMDTRFAQIEARFNSIDARFNAMDARFDGLHQDMGEFYRILGDHGGRLDRVEKRVG